MVSTSNAVGTVGIAHRAKAVVQKAHLRAAVFNASQAIDNAASKLKPGDVILIELHSELHQGQGDYVAMQYFSEVFTAIKVAVNNGIVVVAAAGNGSQDFDAAKYNNTGLQKDCGAIVAGAGVPPSKSGRLQRLRWRLAELLDAGRHHAHRHFFSNYGKIVNVQGWGWHVSRAPATAMLGARPPMSSTRCGFRNVQCLADRDGGGGLPAGGGMQVRGSALTPAQVRKILIDTGTPQAANIPHLFPKPDRATT